MLRIKKLLIAATVSGLLLFPIVPSHSSQSGLRAEVYVFEPGVDMPIRNPDLHERCEVPGVTTESASLNFANVGGGVLAGCQENFVIIRLTGYVTLAPGNYTFSFNGDDGMYLNIAGHELTTDAVDWTLKGGGGSQNVPFTSTSNAPMPLDYWFFEWGGGAFAEVTIRNSQGEVIDQSNLYSYQIAPTSAGVDTPVGMRLVETKRTCEGSSWSLYGERLKTINEIKVAGQTVSLTAVSDELITFDAPKGLVAGKHKVSYLVGDSKATEFVSSLLFKKESTCSSTLLRFPELSAGQSSLGITNGDALTKFLKEDTGPKSVICTGSAHPLESDQAQRLAVSRAQQACGFIKKLYPAARTQVQGFVGKLVTSSNQAVAIRVVR